VVQLAVADSTLLAIMAVLVLDFRARAGKASQAMEQALFLALAGQLQGSNQAQLMAVLQLVMVLVVLAARLKRQALATAALVGTVSASLKNMEWSDVDRSRCHPRRHSVPIARRVVF